jgi:hypothetical protein
MVSHSDLLMYVVAVKSLVSYLGDAQVVIVNDGTLRGNDFQLLDDHLSAKIVEIKTVDCGNCPRGGTWERLLLISHHVQESYVVQLDSDTLTLTDIPEVLAAVEMNRSFTLGTRMGRNISPIKDICEQMKTFKSDHVQVLAEQNFDKLQDYDHLKYTRGCSGFAGFAKESFSRSQVEGFSKQVHAALGDRWLNWGSEQVTSNFIIANSPQSCVLPYPKYANYDPEIPDENCTFLHFIGTYRFKNGVYIRRARSVVEKLKSAKPPHARDGAI